ncbi:lysine transporter LysE [Halomonas cupida]|uniref:Lysine transporter LysE n=1 Tax=Halomonas cupida TaxID=44933 RepID=A0A1M7LL66_9GAMM|nr:LysE family transporter [Halomonas cupida]GEN25282.1 lysine transporter LysE [Halomonas cupida]SHM78919.1 Threonine/homoserine/homoserine lactone efflux protein [Halomonas cupida]
MSTSLLLSMSSFALVASISPGPVNLLVLSTGARFGWRRAMPLVIGASAGFTLLLWLIGMGLSEIWMRLPWLRVLVQLAGVAFLLWLAWRLLASTAELEVDPSVQPAGAMTGAMMQWLNPKAWLASAAGMGIFVDAGNALGVTGYALLWGAICLLSISVWALMGGRMACWLTSRARQAWWNRALAILLVASALALLVG